MNLFKVLTFRTLRSVWSGEPAYWRLSDPLRWPLGIRGSVLAVMDIGYLADRIGALEHWCPLDSGGVRHGFQSAPEGVPVTDLLLGGDSLAELLRRGSAAPTIGAAVTAGSPLWTVAGEPLPGAPVLEEFRARRDRSQEWTYEVFLGRTAAPAPAEVAAIFCPNTAVTHVRDLIGPEFDDKIRSYNPRWSLDAIAVDDDLDRDPLRRRL
jgi:hypothetical protein